MQKKLLAAAVLSAFSGAAAAQSANVTIYGTLYSQFEYGSATGADGTSLANLATTGTAAAPARTYVNNGLNNVGAADPSGRLRTDGAGANFGLRGTEDLGNGLQAWFQLELGTAGAIGGVNNASATSLTGWQAPTYRNSAIGLRGNNWGSFLVGIWDTPYTVAFGQAALVPKLLSLNSANSSAGFYGTNPFTAGGTFSGTSIVQACALGGSNTIAGGNFTAAGPNTCMTAALNMDRRQAGTLQYWTPNWNGFEGRLMFTPTQESFAGANNNQASGTGLTATTSNNLANNTLHPYMWGLSLNYGNGGFFGSYAYQRHIDVMAAGVRQLTGATTAAALGGISLNGLGALTTATTNLTAAQVATLNAQGVSLGQGMSGSTDQAHRIGLKYKFDSGFGIGGRFEYIKGAYQYSVPMQAAPAAGNGTSGGGNLTGFTKKTWGMAGSYETGPHAVQLEFAKIPNSTFQCDNTATAGVNTGGTNQCNGAGTGARQWSLGYDYALSKRTDFQAYYVQVTNDANVKYTGAVFNALAPASGGDPRYFGVGLRHTF